MPRSPSRRSFLSALGLGPAVLPLLDSDVSHGQAMMPAKRLLIVFQSGGVVHDAFWPSTQDLSQAPLPAVTAPLEPYKQQLMFLDGVVLRHFLEYGDHGAGHENVASIFTGTEGITIEDNGSRFWPSTRTFDQDVAAALAEQAPHLPFKSGFFLAPQGDAYNFNISRHLMFPFWRGPDQQIMPEFNPSKAMAALFTGQTPGSMPNPEVERVRAQRKSLLDGVLGDLEAFKGRVGTDDRMRIDQHLQSFRELEQRIGADAGPAAIADACVAPAAPDWNISDKKLYPQNVRIHMDLAIAALACDAARVVGLQLHDASGEYLIHEWAGVSGPGISGYATRNYHDVQHDPGPENADKIKVDRWYQEQFAHLLERLTTIREGDGTMLDNTIVLWANHMGYNHSSHRLGWVVAGGGNKYLKLGQYLRLTPEPSRESSGVPSTRVLATLANAVGVPMETFGDAKYGGELSEMKV